MLNILTEPLIRVTLTGGAAESVSLPETYARLMADTVETFPALRPHQRHAWHAFLCQLAAMALHRAGQSEPPADTDAWIALLRGLTPEWPQDEPWQLVGEDITKPAFMQPPAGSAAKAADYKSRVDTPDELDILVTSRNHDLKGAVVSAAQADDWLFALLTLQTMGLYSAAGTNGQYHTISRVNGTAGSRIAFSLTPSLRLGLHIKRDISALLEMRQELFQKYEFAASGVDLMWKEPWDGTPQEALNLNKLAPYYLEVCRRIRIYRDESGEIYGKQVGTKAARVNAKELRGVVGDPWHPIWHGKKGDVALRLTEADSFGYRQIARCLNPADYELPPNFLTESERRTAKPMFLVARGVVKYPEGAKAVTKGYEESCIPLNLPTIRVLGRAGGAQTLGEVAKWRIEQIAKVKEVLKDALATFIAQGENIYKLKRSEISKLRDRKEIKPWLQRLEGVVATDFFEDLQTEFSVEEKESREEIRNLWLEKVTEDARQILNAAADSLPCPAIYRYKARVGAESAFEGGLLRARLPSLFGKSDKED